MKIRSIVLMAAALSVASAAMGKDNSDINYSANSAKALELFNQGQEKLDNFLIDDARELFAAAVAEDPEFAMAYYEWANSSPNLKDFEELLGRAVELAGKASDAERLVIMSLKAQNDGDSKRGEELLLEAVNLRPNGKRLRYMLGNFYFGQQNYDAAEKEFRMAIGIDPNFAAVYNILAYLLSNQNRYPESIEVLKKYAELRPNDNNPRDSMGEIYLYMGDHENSLKEYGNSLAIDSTFLPSFAGLGHNHVFMGDFARGRAMYKQMEHRAHSVADSNTCMFWTAGSYCHEKRYDLAIETLQDQLEFVRTRKNSSLEAVIYGQFAEIYRETGEFDKALKAAAMERQVAMRPEISKGPRDNFLRDAIFTEAVVFARMGNKDSANSRLNEYRRSAASSTNAVVAGTLNSLEGIIAFYGKDYSAAIAKLLQSNDFDPISIYYLASAYEASGKKNEAEKEFAELSSMNRNSLSYGIVRPWAMSKSKKS